MPGTGRIASVIVVQSSGDLAFDASAQQAVYQAQTLDVPADLYDQHFRVFRFRFRPE